MTSIGIDLGSVSVKVVRLEGDVVRAQVVAHQGRPIETLGAILGDLRDAFPGGPGERRRGGRSRPRGAGLSSSMKEGTLNP
jgi:hypothetical protein